MKKYILTDKELLKIEELIIKKISKLEQKKGFLIGAKDSITQSVIDYIKKY